jgi:hypothetical protein
VSAPLVFISYRRTDSDHATARLHNALVERFGAERVFRDTSSIKEGDPFPDRIKAALSGCKVMLVVLGPSWLSTRLNDPEDWVRREVSEALKPDSGITVIPVRVTNAIMPRVAELPEVLKPLVERNAVELRPDPHFDRDLAALAEVIARLDRFCVFLATDANDRQTTYLHSQLKKRLQKEESIRLVGDLPPPYPLDEHAARARRLIEEADLCVHLLGLEPGEIVVGAESGPTYVLEQAKQALERARSMLFLQPMELVLEHVNDVRYREFLRELGQRNDERFELVREQQEELIKAVLVKKAELLRRREGTAASLTAVLDVHPDDDGKASALVEYLQKRKVTPRVLRPGDIAAPTPREMDERFADILKQAKCFIVVYGAAGYDWVRGRVKQAISVALEPGCKTKVAVCLEPPGEKQSFSSIPVIDNLHRFDAVAVDGLLRGDA